MYSKKIKNQTSKTKIGGFRAKPGYTQHHRTIPELFNIRFGQSIPARRHTSGYGAGYTLIEMLITITIFSGLLIIVLGAFASSSSSSAKVSVLRQKSEAARALIDQVSTDFRFIQTIKNFEVSGFGPPPGVHDCGGQTDCVVSGFSVSDDGAEALLLMHLPGDPDNQFVAKFYEIKPRTDRSQLSLFVTEGRNCTVTNPLDPVTPMRIKSNLDFCTTQLSDTHDLLSSGLVLNAGVGDLSPFRSAFSGLPVVQARASLPPLSPTLHMVFTVKPVDQASVDCLTLDPGSCYKVETTLTAGQSS